MTVRTAELLFAIILALCSVGIMIKSTDGLAIGVADVTGHAMQLMGGYGYSRDYPLEQKLRDGWGWGIAGGAIDIQKVNIASALVGRRFDQRR